MKCWKRLAGAILTVLCCVALLTGCGEESDTVSLRVALDGAVDSLDPAMTTADDNATILLHLYENLLRLQLGDDGSLELTGGVASSYEEQDNYDGTVSYYFTLSAAAKWSDGQNVTAEDFVYAWRRLVSPETASPNAALLSMVVGYEAAAAGEVEQLAVTAEEDGRLKVVTGYHCPFFLRTVCAGAATMPVRSDMVEKFGSNWGRLSQAMVTNGAYVLGQWDVEQALTLIRSPYGGSVAQSVDELKFVFAESEEDAYALLGSGDVDFVAPLPADAAKSKLGADTRPDPYAETELVLFNLAGAFKERAARTAFSLTVDYEALRELASPTDTIADALIPYGVRESDGEDFRAAGGDLIETAAEGYEDRCAQAIAALQGAALALSDVELLCGMSEREKAVANALQSAWQKTLQISVSVTPLDDAALNSRISHGEYDLALATLRADTGDGMTFLSRWSGSTEEETALLGDDYNMLLSVAQGALDPLAWDNYLHAAEEMALEYHAALPLFFRGTTSEKAVGLQNVGYDGLGRYYFHKARFSSQ